MPSSLALPPRPSPNAQIIIPAKYSPTVWMLESDAKQRRFDAPMNYRPDIDGIRAIAILCVLLFHCDFALFSGGFIGVDVFFVISGYLITKLILADLAQGCFSFKEFYARRMRRLLPALVATIAASIFLALFIMAPDHVADAGRSGAYALLSLANFHFSMGGNYFDVSAAYKPFLHTWSLSVEEQFYLAWPAAVFIAYKFGGVRTVGWLVGCGALAGLALSQIWLTINPTHAYFLMPFRSFQFLLGASCVWATIVRIQSVWIERMLFVFGIGFILGTAILYTERTPFPGFNAVLPSAGAALLILSGRAAGLSQILTNRVSISLGKTSYSTYLVHWPIVVFWRYLSTEPFSVWTKIFLLCLSLGVGYALHLGVEQRFRLSKSETSDHFWPPVRRTTIALIATVVVSLAMPLTNGLPQRLSWLPRVEAYSRASGFQFRQDYRDGVLHLGTGTKEKVLIFGDSMAQNYIPALMSMDRIKRAEVEVVSRGGCVFAESAVLVNFGSVDDDCLALRKQLYSLESRYDLVIWSQDWIGYDRKLQWESADGERSPAFLGPAKIDGWRDGIIRTINYFLARSNAVVVIGPQVSVENVNSILTRIGPLTPINDIPKTYGDMRQVDPASRDQLAESMRDIVELSAGASFVDPREIICEVGACRLWEGDYSYYLDPMHHTAASTPFLRQQLKKFKPLTNWDSVR